MLRLTSYLSTTEPVSVNDLKTHLRIDSTSEDSYLEGLLKVARQSAESITHRQLIPAGFALTADQFGAFELRPPLLNTSNISISYVDSTGGTTTVSSTVYELHDDGDGPAILTTAYGQSWPTPQSVKGAVTVSYQAGYTSSTTLATAANPIPESIGHWIKMVAGSMYEHREAVEPGMNTQVPYKFLDGLLDDYVVHVVR